MFQCDRQIFKKTKIEFLSADSVITNPLFIVEDNICCLRRFHVVHMDMQWKPAAIEIETTPNTRNIFLFLRRTEFKHNLF